MNSKKDDILNIVFLIIGELLISLITVGVFLLGDLLFENAFWSFSYRIITGALLGAAVTVLNYCFLILSVNRAVREFLNLRGSAEMSEEEAAAFAAKNAMGVQNAIKTSFLIRTASILVTLIVAFLLDWFSAPATVIPLLAFRPLIGIIEKLKLKFFGDGTSYGDCNTIIYETHEIGSVVTDITEKKESDE